MSGILVVDDDQAVAAFCSQLFTEAGHQTEVVYSGEAALAALKRRPFEIVVSDISMPGLSGLDLLKAVKAQPSSPDMILITGYGSVPDAVAAVKGGAFDYIEKPVEPERLLEAVGTLTELRRKRTVDTGIADMDFPSRIAQPAGVDHRRAGNRQGTGGASNPSREPSRALALRRSELRNAGR
jgi:DNA-binding NtrC family response regulator